MRFLPLELAGAFLIEDEPARDERGWFARTFCGEEFSRRGLSAVVAQCSVSHNARRGTLRGLHYQGAPHEEAKLVRCARGRLFDVILDLRDGSPTRGKWLSLELSAAEGRSLYVPEGFAHGFQTLEDDTQVFYQISRPYRPESARGVRWDDPKLAIPWPPGPRVISKKDAALPLFQ